MSVQRQVIATAVVVLSCLALGAWLIVYFGMRDYLANDASSQAQDAAMALGQSLSPALASADDGLATSIIDSVYDGARYREIRVQSAALDQPIERIRDSGVAGVPAWFTRLVPIPSASADVRLRGDDGARHSISVVLDSGDAYRRLWTWGLQLLLLFAVAILVLWAIVWLHFKRFSKPLAALTARINGFSQRDFPQQPVSSAYRELSALGHATNTANSVTRETLASLDAQIDALDTRLKLDAVTELQNRNSISDHHGSDFSDVILDEPGALVIVDVDGLDELNRVHGAHATDNVLFDIGDALRQQCVRTGSAKVWRLSGSRFMCRSALVDEHHVDVWCRSIANDLDELAAQSAMLEPGFHTIGGCVFKEQQTLADALAFAEDVLVVARQDNDCRVYSPTKVEAEDLRFANDKAAAMMDRLNNDALTTLFRPALWLENHKPYHTQVVLGLPDQSGELMPDATLSGLLARTGLQTDYLTKCLTAAVDTACEHPDLAFAFDIGAVPSTTARPRDQDADARAVADWLDLFRDRLKVVPGFALQIRESAFSENVLEALIMLRETLQSSEMRLGINAVGATGIGFGYLQALKPDYVVSPAYVGRRLQDDAGCRFHLDTLANMAKDLDIDLIVAGIDDRHRWQRARECGATAGMGDYAGRMRPTVPTVLDRQTMKV